MIASKLREITLPPPRSVFRLPCPALRKRPSSLIVCLSGEECPGAQRVLAPAPRVLGVPGTHNTAPNGPPRQAEGTYVFTVV